METVNTRPSNIIGVKLELTVCFQLTAPVLASIENNSFLLFEKYIELFTKTKSEFSKVNASW